MKYQKVIFALLSVTFVIESQAYLNRRVRTEENIVGRIESATYREHEVLKKIAIVIDECRETRSGRFTYLIKLCKKVPKINRVRTNELDDTWESTAWLEIKEREALGFWSTIERCERAMERRLDMDGRPSEAELIYQDDITQCSDLNNRPI